MFHTQIKFDGIWLEMDEAANYCTGDVCQNPGIEFTKPNNACKGPGACVMYLRILSVAEPDVAAVNEPAALRPRSQLNTCRQLGGDAAQL